MNDTTCIFFGTIQAVFVNNSRGTLWLLKRCKIQSLLLYVLSRKLTIFSLILSYSVFFFVFSLTYLAGEHRASYTVMQQI